MTISASLAALTASLQDSGVGASLALLTGDFDGQEGPVALVSGSFESLTASIASPGNNDGSISAQLEELTSAFAFPAALAGTLEVPSASIAGAMGAVGTLDAGALMALSASLAGVAPQSGIVAAVMQAPAGAFTGAIVLAGSVDSALRQAQGQFTGVMGAVGSVSAALELPLAALSGVIVLSGTMGITLPRATAYMRGEPALGTALETWAMNTRSNALTRYPSYPANSFASYNGTYLGAGPTGLLLLQDPDDSAVQWVIRTGQTDDKRANLKRLTEVLMGLRFSSPIRLRIYKDDDTYYDYTIPAQRPGALQQVRAKVGKGLRSRYYMVEVSGQGPLTLDSLQATMPDTSRRLG